MKYALITPSYYKDFEYCRLQCETIDRFIEPPYIHYLIIDKRDRQQFSVLKGPRRIIIDSESILPWWIFQIPLVKSGWLSLKSLPLRNWIVQQLKKIAIAQYIQEDVLLFLDSDTAVIRPFQCTMYEKEGLVRLFRVPNNANTPAQHPWQRTAGKLLGLPIQDYYGAGYIGNPITWLKSNVLKLYDTLEKVGGKPWIESIISQWNLSEYILYGIFVDQILKETSGHYYDSTSFTVEYWNPQDLSQNQRNNLIRSVKPDQKFVMINSKARIEIELYRQIVEEMIAINIIK